MEILKILGTSLFSLAVLFALTKLMGNKQVSQLTLFDYIVGITIGSIAAELATDLENPVQPTTAMVVYGLVAVLISLCTNKSNHARAFFAGKPLILMENGKLSKSKLKKARMDVNEFLTMARVAGYFDISQLETAVFEHNGNLSFLPKAEYRPANPGDMKLPVQQEKLLYNIIVDGNLMERELQAAGKEEIWLKKQLEQEGYNGVKEVFLGIVDYQGKVTFFPME